MSRYIDIEPVIAWIYEAHWQTSKIKSVICRMQTAPSIDICFCKECKHRPIKEDADGADYGFNLIAPNEQELCPCLVEDGWYSWMPEDDFYCGYGCREEE